MASSQRSSSWRTLMRNSSSPARFGVLGEAQWFWGLGGVSFLNQPSSWRAQEVGKRFYWCRGQVQGNSAKIQIKHLGNLERIHRQNLKFIDQADVRGVWIWRAQESAKPFARQVSSLPKLNNGGTLMRSSSWRTS